MQFPLRLMSLMASASRTSCFQALAPAGDLNSLVNFPYRLEVSNALSFPDLRRGRCLLVEGTLCLDPAGEITLCSNTDEKDRFPAVFLGWGMSCLKWSYGFHF